MKHLRSGTLCLALAVGLLVTAIRLAPGCAARIGLDPVELQRLAQSISEEQRIAQRLEVRQLARQERARLREAIMADAIAGRLTPAVAVSEIRRVNATAPEEDRRQWRALFPVWSDEDMARHMGITWLEGALLGRPDLPHGSPVRVEEVLAGWPRPAPAPPE